jgi:hypothetical protein
LANPAVRAVRDAEYPDRAVGMERIGGDIIEMRPRPWDRMHVAE